MKDVRSVYEVHYSTIGYGMKRKRFPHVMYVGARDEAQAIQAVMKWCGPDARILYVEERPDGSFLDAAMYLSN